MNGYRNIRFFIYNTKIGISNLIEWFNVIYNDRNWDHWYIFNIFAKKLEIQAKHIKKNSLTTCTDKIIEDMLYAAELLKKIRNDEYGKKEVKAHNEKWGKGKFRKELTEEEKKQEEKELLKIYENCEKEMKEDIKNVFLFIGEHIQEWWE
jgi:hypothetical protein